MRGRSDDNEVYCTDPEKRVPNTPCFRVGEPPATRNKRTFLERLKQYRTLGEFVREDPDGIKNLAVANMYYQ